MTNDSAMSIKSFTNGHSEYSNISSLTQREQLLCIGMKQLFIYTVSIFLLQKWEKYILKSGKTKSAILNSSRIVQLYLII